MKLDCFGVPKVRTFNHGSESVRYLSLKIWEVIPTYIRGLDITEKFKIAIKKWKPEFCMQNLFTKYRLHIDLTYICCFVCTYFIKF